MKSVFEEKQDCCGCTACEHICPTNAIRMVADEEGFLYPEIKQELCIDCGLCVETCAFQKGYDTSGNYKSPQVYAIKHNSDVVRENSSSGGAFTAISDYVLSINGIIYGVGYDENMKVLHLRTDTKKGRDSFRGSKYVQSDLNDVYNQVKDDLIKNRYVLFTGTACQTAGLQRYLMKSKVSTDELLLVDIVCHGTPSPLTFREFLSYLEKKNKSKVAQYHFRSKVNGWGHTEEIIFNNGKKDYTSHLSQIHKELFYSDLCLRPSCHECKYTNFIRPSDITMADYWGIESYLPEFNDKLGVSAMIINTKKGSNVYSNIEKSMDSILSNIEDCAKRQRNLHEPSAMNPKRNKFWADYNNKGFEYVVKKYSSYGFKGRLKFFIKKVLSKLGMLEFAKKLLNPHFKDK